MWYLIFAETIPVPNWTGLCLGSFVTLVGLMVLVIYLGLKDKRKSEGIPFEALAVLDASSPTGDGDKSN